MKKPCYFHCYTHDAVLSHALFAFRLQLADGFNGADLRNVGTEAGLFAIRADRDYVLEVSLLFGVTGTAVS